MNKTTSSRNGTTGNVGYYHSYKYQSLDFLHRIEKMHGIRRVVTFCLLTMVLPIMLLIVPLYLRHSVFADIQFAVTESDVVEITDGISPVFCSEHRLKMNETFNAFQVSKGPERTTFRKHLRLKKSMTLPDDTLEYWGFFLLKDARVVLSVCSRLQGASILVVKGERTLRTCGMLDHNQNKAKTTNIYFPKADQQVKVTFESNAQEIHSQETISHKFKEESRQTIQVNNNKLEDVKKTSDGGLQRQSRKLAEKDPNKASINVVDEERELNALVTEAEKYLSKHLNSIQTDNNSTDKPRHHKRRATRLNKVEYENDQMNTENVESDGDHIHTLEHRKKHRKDLESKKKLGNRHKERMKQLKQELGLNDEEEEQEKSNHGKEEGIDEINRRYKRSQQPIKPALLDQGFQHGGNAGNITDDSSSTSSFENGLFSCYDGNVLLAHKFDPSDECDINYLLKGNKHMQTEHNVTEDGYYYYIFYSDHDDEKNDIHAIFDIYKPTLQFAKDANKCINKTECAFPLTMTSIDKVIVEVPTRDGIDHEIDDISVLISTCVPRMGIYVIFPIAVLFLVLGCAFM